MLKGYATEENDCCWSSGGILDAGSWELYEYDVLHTFVYGLLLNLAYIYSRTSEQHL